jgi:hypothetical protein
MSGGMVVLLFDGPGEASGLAAGQVRLALRLTSAGAVRRVTISQLFEIEVIVRQKLLRWAEALLIIAICLLAFVSVLAFLWHVEEATPWAAMNAAEWGVWVGSIGTIGAFVGTIWIATTTSRIRRNEALMSARLHAISMVWRLVYIHATMSTALDILKKANVDSILQQRSLVEETINEITFWPIRDLLPLVPLKDNLAGKLAQAADQVGLAIELLKRTRSMTPPEIMRYIPSAINMIESADKLTEQSMQICRAEANTMNLFPE